MERLTEYESIAGHAHALPKILDMNIIVQKLADYEDKQEQGLLIELPVPLGTKVYMIEDVYEEIYHPSARSYMVVEATFDYEFIPAWGEWVFATRSEAEEALAKMGE
ncbi:MAG: hypothetical protein J6Q93_01455 [Prevotella sp.]|nr:hypothetical protein [Prevotella sp.]